MFYVCFRIPDWMNKHIAQFSRPLLCLFFICWFLNKSITMSRKPKKGYFVRGQFVAEGSELDLQYKAELKGTTGATKTDLKREMDALQKLGAELLTLRTDLFARLDLPEKLQDALAEARRIPFPKGKTQLLAGMSGTACFALIFGGTIRSALAAAAAGLIVSGYLLLCENRRLSNGFRKISAAALITLVCILGCHLLDTEASHAIIGALMILTPGIAFTMGIRDFVQGDYLSGTIRMIDALLIAASIAIGTGLVLSLISLLTGVTVV